MAEQKQQYIREKYAGGSIILSNVRDSVTDKTYTLTKVEELPDGTPLTDDVVQGESPVYRKVGDEYFINNELKQFAGRFNKYRIDAYGIFQQGNFHACEGGFATVGEDLLYIFRRATAFEHTSNTGEIWATRSTDGGETWGEAYLVYTDSLDSRNIVTGNAPNGDIVIICSRYDKDLGQHVSLFNITSSDGITWSAATDIDRTGIPEMVPFGEVFTRGANTYFVNYSAYLSTAKLWESTDNGVTWAVVQELYNNPELELSEPFLKDLPNGNSIILVRNNTGDPTNVSYYQFSSTDGLNYTLDGPTNMEVDLGVSMQSPVGIAVEGNNVIVMTSERYAFLDDRNTDSKARIWVSTQDQVVGNAETWIVKHEIPRPFGQRSSFYGYFQAKQVGDKIVVVCTDRKRYNRSRNISLSNEKASLYTFNIDILNTAEKYFNTQTLYQGKELKNKHTNNIDYVLTENDRQGYEDDFPISPDFIWRPGTTDPEATTLGGQGRMALLQELSSNNPQNYPQGTNIGGVVLLAVSADNHVKWMLGRGAVNSDQGKLFCQTYNSSTEVWSGWKALALEEEIATQALVTNPSANGGPVELLTSGDDVFNIQGSGAFGTSGAITNTPNATNAFVIFNVQANPTTWAQLAIPTGGPQYNSAPVYINNRPGTDAWRPMAMQGDASYETRTNAQNDLAYVGTSGDQTGIQGNKNWEGLHIFEGTSSSKIVFRKLAGTNVVRFEDFDGTTATNQLYIGRDTSGNFIVSRDGGLTEVFITANESGVQVDNLIANSIQGDVVADQATVDAGVDNSTVVTPLTLQTTLNQGAMTSPIPAPTNITGQTASTAYDSAELQQVMLNQETISQRFDELVSYITELEAKLDQVITK